jgi:predicted acetyltransferase
MDLAPLRLRPGTDGDWGAISELLGLVFHNAAEPETRAGEGAVFEPGRSIVAADGELVAGHAAAYTRDLTVPGAIVPAAHVTLVGVRPTHRRRGLLNAMMRRQLDEIAAAGREPVAALWASETRIYPRYGYGPAAQRLTVEAATRELVVGVPDGAGGRLRMVEPVDAIAGLSAVYERLRPHRPGWSTRDDRWWRFVLADEPSRRGGATPLRGVVHDTPAGPTGYALWRTASGWDAYGPDAEVRVREVVADDPAAYAALWRFLLTIDLARTATAGFLALDDPLPHLVDEPRRLGTRVQDALWVRIVDLPAALAARRYATGVDVVFEVADPYLPGNAGRWRLTGGPDGATCARTGAPADLACTALELGTVYLGGPTLTSLAAAGRVRELTPGALARTSTAFGWHRMPNPTEVF